MANPESAPLTAHLLYAPGAALAEPSAFANDLDAALHRRDMPRSTKGQEGPRTHAFRVPGARVDLALVTSPCPDTLLSPALGSPMLALKPTDLAARARAHAARAVLTVSPTDSETGPLSRAKRMALFHRALLALLDNSAPDAVLVEESGMLFTPDEVEDTRDMTLPLPLFLHPLPVAAAGVPTVAGVLPPLGAALPEAARFCGKPVLLAPSPVPLGEALALVGALLRDHAGGELRLDDGMTLRNPGTGDVFVRHFPPDDAAPDGRILVGLGSWPDEGALRARPLTRDDLTPRSGNATAHHEPRAHRGLLARARQVVFSPNGLVIIGAIVLYVTLSHIAADWIESQAQAVISAPPRDR